MEEEEDNCKKKVCLKKKKILLDSIEKETNVKSQDFQLVLHEGMFVCDKTVKEAPL